MAVVGAVRELGTWVGTACSHLSLSSPEMQLEVRCISSASQIISCEGISLEHPLCLKAQWGCGRFWLHSLELGEQSNTTSADGLCASGDQNVTTW